MAPPVRARVGSVPETRISRSAGQSPATVDPTLTELGTPRAVGKSKATNEARDRLRKLSKRDLAKLDPIDAKIVEARYLRGRPETFAQI